MKIRVVLISALLTVIFAADTFACGDSLYRVGKGVSYRVYTAPLPGSVLVYGQSEGAAQLAEALAQSGHSVHLADTQLDLAAELETGNYDVVIAPYSDRGAVEASANSIQEVKTAYLPVAMNKDEAKTASQDYRKVMVAEQDEIKHYLKAIHKSLKSRT